MKRHARNGKFVRVSENLYRYSSSKTYYAVYRREGKLVWKSLGTTDRELAKRRLKEEIATAGRIDARQKDMSVESLLRLYEEQLSRFDVGTQVNRKSILHTFRTTWKYGLDLPVKDVSPAQLDTWLAQHRARIKRTSLNAYIVFLRQVFNLAISVRVLAESPAAGLKMLKPEEPIRFVIPPHGRSSGKSLRKSGARNSTTMPVNPPVWSSSWGLLVLALLSAPTCGANTST